MVKLRRIIQLIVCIGLLSTVIGCASTQKHESTGQYVDDSVITTKVKAAIFNEATLKTLQINVKTYKSVVQLSGSVDSSRSITRAEEVAKRVEGVVAVKNELVVK
jgi:osmotically-inducible protein OsmY